MFLTHNNCVLTVPLSHTYQKIHIYCFCFYPVYSGHNLFIILKIAGDETLIYANNIQMKTYLCFLINHIVCHIKSPGCCRAEKEISLPGLCPNNMRALPKINLQGEQSRVSFVVMCSKNSCQWGTFVHRQEAWNH